MFASTLAANALALGDLGRARELLEEADQSLVTTKITQGMAAMIQSRPDEALRLMMELQKHTRGLRQVEIWRISIAASAQLALGNFDATRLALSQLLEDVDDLRGHELTAFVPELHAFACEEIPSWPATAEGNPRILTPLMSQVLLSSREREVLGLLAAGKNREQIAECLFLSKNTIKSHISSLYRKFGVSRKHQLLSEAHRRSVI